MILADDARFDEFGYAGNKIIQTPNIDKLAARGVVFNNAYVTTAICVVSRASIFTGQHARAHGIWNFSDPVGHERWQRTYPHLLRASGYYTGMIGKFGIGRKPEHLPSDDFDFWRSRPGNLSYFDKSSPEHLTKRIGDQALEFLSTAPANKPWCLNIGFKAPTRKTRRRGNSRPTPATRNSTRTPPSRRPRPPRTRRSKNCPSRCNAPRAANAGSCVSPPTKWRWKQRATFTAWSPAWIGKWGESSMNSKNAACWKTH
ncbi:hypothetical protein CKA38_07140 [Ereboglobus luteus]|uniref:Sulfatase N-terminal domain-containing protein n=1 Tax=Ereboglobus luteus TaxID=1796921 RepID=A0A2U8E2M9_9BACT|nr:hypothetical protein CKA38_07140 [Ereboglobus luteus]